MLGLAIFGGFAPSRGMFVSACGVLGTPTFWKASRSIRMANAGTSRVIADGPARSDGGPVRETV